MAWPPTEDDMRLDGVEKPKGIYCRRCGYLYLGWTEFFSHHRERHQGVDPEALKSIMDDADRYIRRWRELLGLGDRVPWSQP